MQEILFDKFELESDKFKLEVDSNKQYHIFKLETDIVKHIEKNAKKEKTKLAQFIKAQLLVKELYGVTIKHELLRELTILGIKKTDNGFILLTVLSRAMFELNVKIVVVDSKFNIMDADKSIFGTRGYCSLEYPLVYEPYNY